MVCLILSEKPTKLSLNSTPLTNHTPLEKMGVSGLGHRRSFGGSRPQTSPPRFLELVAPDTFARAFARLEKDLRTSLR
jgi:hypothetical protein